MAELGDTDKLAQLSRIASYWIGSQPLTGIMQIAKFVQPTHLASVLLFTGLVLGVVCPAFDVQQVEAAAAAQQGASPVDAGESDWALWASGRYRITPGDVIDLVFIYVPEFNQTVTVQPDGYVSLRGLRDLHAQGRTVPIFQREVAEAYAGVLRDPVVTVVLKEFEKPYFVAVGEVAHPGKFELRGATTLTQALAFAGGMTRAAKSSQVVLFRRFSSEYLEVKKVEVRKINAKKMFSSGDLSEDVLLRPGDTVFVPPSVLSQIAPFIPRPSLGLYLDPFAMAR